MNNEKLEEFIDIVDQLEPKARQDVLDMSAFLIWRQTQKPVAWHTIIRGSFLFSGFKVHQLAQRIKTSCEKCSRLFGS